MPFFSHVDLFSEYRRIIYAIDNDLYFANSHRVVTYYIEMLFAGISKLFIPASEVTFFLPDPSHSTSSVQEYFLFLQDKYIYRYLFFFKLPYLLFDLGVAAIIWRFVDNLRDRKIALLIWLFNPITLFATYAFGRFEVISIFFLAMTVIQLKYHRFLMASIMFGIALHCREINIIFTPFLLIAMIDFKDHPVRNFIVVGAYAALIGVIYLLPDWIIPQFGDVTVFVNPDSEYHSEALNKMFSFAYHWFFPIIFGLGALAFYAWEIGKRDHLERFVITASCALFIYFAFNIHSVHYAAWLILFPLLSIQFGRKVVLPFLVLFVVWVALWLLKTDGGVFTPFLAAPLSFEFVGIGHFPTYFNEHYASESLTLHRAIQVVRTLFTLSMAFFAYRLLRR